MLGYNTCESEIFVSAASLCRIMFDGKYLLGQHKRTFDTKQKVLFSPIGGCFTFDEAARPFLLGLGAKFVKGDDLRLIT